MTREASTSEKDTVMVVARPRSIHEILVKAPVIRTGHKAEIVSSAEAAISMAQEPRVAAMVIDESFAPHREGTSHPAIALLHKIREVAPELSVFVRLKNATGQTVESLGPAPVRDTSTGAVKVDSHTMLGDSDTSTYEAIRDFIGFRHGSHERFTGTRSLENSAAL